MRISLLLSAAAFTLVACGAPEAETDTAAEQPDTTPTPIPVEPDGGIGDGAGPPEDAETVEEPSAFAQTFPAAIRGKWRSVEDGKVTAARCDNTVSSNMGKVLTVRADSYSYFESGGRFISVGDREPGRIRAVFDTTYADEPTRDELAFRVDPVAKTLTVENFDTGERGTVTYRRCP